MAIDTNDKKLALMEWDLVWEPGLPLDETAGFDQGDKQQLLWAYPGILWSAAITFKIGLTRINSLSKVRCFGSLTRCLVVEGKYNR